MKKLFFILAALVIAAAAYASTAITVTPSTMKDGETKVLTDDGTTIKVTREGDSTNIKIDGAHGSRTITVTHGGDGDITINRNGHRFHIETPDVVVPQVPPVRMRRLRESHLGTIYVCPKDGTTLRIPDGDKKELKDFKCPVDGTPMEKKTGHGFAFYFDDSDFDAFDSL